MHRNSIHIVVILVIAIALLANSFHRHPTLSSMTKCPVCSGAYTSANTHVTIDSHLVSRPEPEPAAPVFRIPTYEQISVFYSFRNRAPPTIPS